MKATKRKIDMTESNSLGTIYLGGCFISQAIIPEFIIISAILFCRDILSVCGYNRQYITR